MALSRHTVIILSRCCVVLHLWLCHTQSVPSAGEHLRNVQFLSFQQAVLKLWGLKEEVAVWLDYEE